jgi:hypothetical protein
MIYFLARQVIVGEFLSPLTAIIVSTCIGPLFFLYFLAPTAVHLSADFVKIEFALGRKIVLARQDVRFSLPPNSLALAIDLPASAAPFKRATHIGLLLPLVREPEKLLAALGIAQSAHNSP